MSKNNDILYFGTLKRPRTRQVEKPTPKRETLAQFLARGGKIQRVPPGAGKLTLAEIEQEELDETLLDFQTTVRSKK